MKYTNNQYKHYISPYSERQITLLHVEYT